MTSPKQCVHRYLVITQWGKKKEECWTGGLWKIKDSWSKFDSEWETPPSDYFLNLQTYNWMWETETPGSSSYELRAMVMRNATWEHDNSSHVHLAFLGACLSLSQMLRTFKTKNGKQNFLSPQQLCHCSFPREAHSNDWQEKYEAWLFCSTSNNSAFIIPVSRVPMRLFQHRGAHLLSLPSLPFMSHGANAKSTSYQTWNKQISVLRAVFPRNWPTSASFFPLSK